MPTDIIASTFGEQPPQTVVPYYNNGIQVVAAIAGNSLLSTNMSLTAGVWTNLVTGIAGTRNYILYCVLSVLPATSIVIRPTGHTGNYINIYISAGIPVVFDYRPCGFNKGQIGDGIEVYAGDSVGLYINLLYQNVPAVF